MTARRARTRTLLEGADGAVVRRTTLPNGLRVVTESVPGVRSVSFGAWIGVGSRDETPRQTGAAHFLEHLLFKGTATRSAWEITAPIEAVGGEMNAFTTKEYTCYYARVLDDDTDLAIETVCDVVLNGRLDSADIEGEREVILEEIAMNDDDPGDVVHDLYMRTHYGDSPLGRPILGTQESLESLTPQGIRSFYRRHYVAPSMVVAAAGAVDHDEVVARVREAFRDADTPAEPGSVRSTRRAPVAPGRGSRGITHRSSEQAHLVLGLGASGVPTIAATPSACSMPHSAAACRVVSSRAFARSVVSPTPSIPSPRASLTRDTRGSTSAACRTRSVTCSRSPTG